MNSFLWKFFNSLSGALFTLLTVAAATTLQAGDVASYSVTKGILFRQISGAPPVIRDGLPYVFQSLVVPTSSSMVTSARVQWSFADLPMLGITTPAALAFIQRLPNQDALDGTFPNGEFRILMQAVNDGSHTGRLSVLGNDYPSPPYIQGFTGVQSVDAQAAFVLQWGAFSGGTAADLIYVQIENSQGRVFATGAAPGLPGALDGTATSVTLPANTLQPGRAYVGRIVFVNFTAFNTADYPGVQGAGGYFTQTDFDVKTLGAGDTTPPALSSTVPSHGATNVPINSPVVFQFSEPMSRGIALGISGTSAGRTFEWSADSTTLVATPTTNWPPNSTIIWTLNLFYTQLAFGDANGNSLPMETILSFTTGLDEAEVAAPHLIDAKRLPNGRFQFRVTGESNRAFVVQASTNALTWSSLTTNVAFLGGFDFLDTNSPPLPQRLYRAVAP